MSEESDAFDRGYYGGEWDVYDSDGDFVEGIWLEDGEPYRGQVLFLQEGAYVVKRWNEDNRKLYCRRDYNYD
ncbi:MAG: hypothetical protein IKO56_07610 [Alphaproteobacteria bacterium]|nr:hypothetical protein [Alphaproteobacteria bacterium]